MSRTVSMGLESTTEECPWECSLCLTDPKDNTKSFMCKEFVNISLHGLRRTLSVMLKFKKNQTKHHSYLGSAQPQICLIDFFSSSDVWTNLLITYLRDPHELYRSLLSSIAVFGVWLSFSDSGNVLRNLSSKIKSSWRPSESLNFKPQLFTPLKIRVYKHYSKEKQIKNLSNIPSVLYYL